MLSKEVLGTASISVHPIAVAFCRSLKLFHLNSGKVCFHGPWIVLKAIVIL